MQVTGHEGELSETLQLIGRLGGGGLYQLLIRISHFHYSPGVLIFNISQRGLQVGCVGP